MAKTKDITVVTAHGRVSIPAELRHDLDLLPGSRLRWEKVSTTEMRVSVLPKEKPVGAQAMRGFARRFRPEPRTTAEWMLELRGRS